VGYRARLDDGCAEGFPHRMAADFAQFKSRIAEKKKSMVIHFLDRSFTSAMSYKHQFRTTIAEKADRKCCQKY
jgi:hypothetical protein